MVDPCSARAISAFSHTLNDTNLVHIPRWQPELLLAPELPVTSVTKGRRHFSVFTLLFPDSLKRSQPPLPQNASSWLLRDLTLPSFPPTSSHSSSASFAVSSLRTRSQSVSVPGSSAPIFPSVPFCIPVSSACNSQTRIWEAVKPAVSKQGLRLRDYGF